MKFRPLRIFGSATFTTETSRITMNWARQASSSVARRWCVWLCCAVWCCGAAAGTRPPGRLYDVHRTLAAPPGAGEKFRRVRTNLLHSMSEMGTMTVGQDACATDGTAHPTVEGLELADVLHALSDPVRLRIVSTLATRGELPCGAIDLPVVKSTCTHHFRVLREAGLIRQRTEGTTKLNSLRRAELDGRFPGLLKAVLAGSPVAESSA